jgi:NtrC-family two-component system response regulator AlgB
MKLGAADYLAKPLCLDRVRSAVRRIIDERSDERPSVEPASAEIFFDSESALFRSFLATSERAAAADCVVLLRGESGTGKNVLAEWMHARSKRSDGPFVAVNCPSLAGELMASTLFGHRRGAFTGAVADALGKGQEANGGTLFLDEIGDLSLDAQARVLRFLHDRTYERVGEAREERADVRILAATNRDLDAQTRAGAFREDLLFRLDVITLTLPPLRDRGPADILALARHFLGLAMARHGRASMMLSREAEEAIVSHRWPGNLRELRHAIERAVVLAAMLVIEPYDLGLDRIAARDRATPELGAAVPLEEIEREHIARILARAPSVDAAARLLRIDTTTLQRKRRRFGLA